MCSTLSNSFNEVAHLLAKLEQNLAMTYEIGWDSYPCAGENIWQGGSNRQSHIPQLFKAVMGCEFAF